MQKRNALVTGATSGIGRAIANALLEHGHKVVGTGRSSETPFIEKNSQENFFYYPADLVNFAKVDGLFDFAQKKLGIPPDLAVINAGVGLPGSLLSSDYSKWSNLFDINCKSTFYQLKVASELMLQTNKLNSIYKQKQKDIIVLSSVIGRNISESNPVYGATKFALTSAVESLRKEICHESIRITVMEPGFVRSNFQERSGYNLKAFDELEEKFGPFLNPEDIAQMVVFAISQPSHVNLSNMIIRPTRQKA